jgi:P4 family phage/plasmid primase-like protien
LVKVKGRVRDLLPRILSIVPYGRAVSEVKTGLISPLKEKIKLRERKEKKTYRHQNVAEQLAIARRLLPMLAEFRAEDRNEWMTVGWALYNISDGSADGLDLWCDFSSRSEEQYDEGTCIFQWERMVHKDITLGTLRYYASIDNATEYTKFKHEEAEKHIRESLSGSHNDIAKALHAEFGDEFVCASIAGKVWFQFINHRWEQIEEGVFLREKISGTIVQRFAKAGKELFGKLSQTNDKAEEAMINARIKMVQKMCGNLKSAPYKNNVMKEAMEVFYDKRFREKLDTNAYLIAFNNGVYDLKLNIFRPGRPEDFISKSMPIDYIDYDEDDEKVQEVYTFLEKIFPDKSVRLYFLDTSCGVFVGGNQQKIVVFWTGEGDNGKSITQNFFERMLGKLAIKFNTNVVTGKKPNTGAANADLARAGGGVRWAVLEEPDGDEMINNGTLKHLSGNDSFYARDLFERGKDGREITPMFKLTFICNKLPKMKYSDKATWNRTRVLPFESTFCRPDDPAPETYEEQLLQKRFPMDKKFSLKIPGLVPAFAWVLLQHRIKTQDRPIIEPEKVRAATEIYRKQNDIYRQFSEEHIAEDDSKVLSLTELYSQFKEWFRESIPNHSIPPRSDVEEYFARLWGDPEKGKRWPGYRIRTIQEQEDAGDRIVLGDDDLIEYEIEDETDNENNLPPL